MKPISFALVLAATGILQGYPALAQTPTPVADSIPGCDCQQPVGACSASISVRPVETTTLGSYAAELKFTSSAPACSKINYYVDGTSYFNVLVSGNTGTDNIWGAKQVSRANLTDISCQVCKQVSITPISQDKKPVKSESKPTLFDGQWSGAGNNSFGSAQRWTLSFATTAAGKAAITGTMEGNFPTVPISASGTVSGNGNTLSWLDQQTACSAKLLTDVSLAFECHGQGSVQIVMRRQ